MGWVIQEEMSQMFLGTINCNCEHFYMMLVIIMDK